MSGKPHEHGSGIGGAARRFVAGLTGAPACAICGRGHASTGWLADSLGRISGRCPGCVEDVSLPPPDSHESSQKVAS